ncbi:MAG: copper chaperone [Patescibacteria group bacterium]|nr:copper chaperone [Patescibacteria group bacterium]MDQ5970856.1 copper chaperone [Patescibacteria group bacterium]MDQ5970884.1 copper chaperone [Patescibacteria group bacterium]
MTQEITLKIIGMHCTACAMNIDGALEDAGVEEARTSFAKQEVKLKFDEQKIDLAEIKKIIKAEGYEVN